MHAAAVTLAAALPAHAEDGALSADLPMATVAATLAGVGIAGAQLQNAQVALKDQLQKSAAYQIELVAKYIRSSRAPRLPSHVTKHLVPRTALVEALQVCVKPRGTAGRFQGRTMTVWLCGREG